MLNRLFFGSASILLASTTLLLADASDPWKRLARPLDLPPLASGGRCPVSQVGRHVDWEQANIFGGSGIGRGPVYPGLGANRGRLTATQDRQYGGAWAGGKVFWYVLPRYQGLVLIRGQRIGGRNRLGFNGTRVPKYELRIRLNETVVWRGQPSGSRGVASSVRVRVPGCYGAQIDGENFSYVVVFTASIP